MKMQGLSMWEMNLGFRPKDFQNVWGAIIQKNSPAKPRMAVKDNRQGSRVAGLGSRALSA